MASKQARELEVHRVCSSLDPDWYRMTPQAQSSVFTQAVRLGLLTREVK